MTEAIIRANAEWAVKGVDIWCGDCLQIMSGIEAGRKFVGIENDKKYFDIARQRIAKAAGEEVIG